MSTDKSWVTQLDEEARHQRDRSSFHVFAEGQHLDVRGQIYNLEVGGEVVLPHDQRPRRVFVVVGIEGQVDARIENQVVPLRALSQVVVTPGTPCKLTARSPAAVEIISLLSNAG